MNVIQMKRIFGYLFTKFFFNSRDIYIQIFTINNMWHFSGIHCSHSTRFSYSSILLNITVIHLRVSNVLTKQWSVFCSQ